MIDHLTICLLVSAAICGLVPPPDAVSLSEVQRPPLAISRSPIACTPAAMSPEEFERRGRLLQRITTQVEEIRETKSGYRFRLPSTRENIETLAAWIALERECCRFLTLALEFEPDGGPTWLEIAGPEGTKAFLDQFMNR